MGIFLFSGFFFGGVVVVMGVEREEILFCSEKVISFTCCRSVTPGISSCVSLLHRHMQNHMKLFFKGGGQENGGAPYLS